MNLTRNCFFDTHITTTCGFKVFLKGILKNQSFDSIVTSNTKCLKCLTIFD